MDNKVWYVMSEGDESFLVYHTDTAEQAVEGFIKDFGIDYRDSFIVFDGAKGIKFHTQLEAAPSWVLASER